ncbi:F-box protein At-B [Cucurbita maxima]|uniref:F-box protein At-B n=1 Tax=Cucurbita maxima TaxID=3661 RepID=A0A6J1ILN7_CUCMA|nr:F-box protein At-B [Cucurbita maxima]
MALQRFPRSVLVEILLKLDPETLCSVACVSKALQFAVVDAISFLSTLHLPITFFPDSRTLKTGILGRCRGMRSLTVNCLRLDDSSLVDFLGPNLLELNLLCCSSLSSKFLAEVGKLCPNLRVLVLELAAQDDYEEFNRNLAEMLTKCLLLDSISLKIRGAGNVETNSFSAVEAFLPKTTKTLKLKSLLHEDAICIINKLRDSGNSLINPCSRNFESPPLSTGLMLQCLSLTLDVISDELIMTIVDSLPFLVELHLEDMANPEQLVHLDLTNRGLHSLSTCHNLKSLSLMRGRYNHQVSFKKLNDMGMFLLSEGCKGLESVRFCGFSKVSDAGFASILHSCNRLKKFEIRYALYLSDLAFDGFDAIGCFVTELRLFSCSLITCESVKHLAYSTRLEVLDLCGCKSISDSCLDSISTLCHLSSLILTATDVTDFGLSVLGQGRPPIVRLSLRSCKRVTDEGIYRLFHGGGTVSKTLSVLDIGHISGITDRAIQIIASVGVGITELCIRSCFHVTDSSVEALAMKKHFEGEGKSLCRLDLFNCIALSIDACRSFREPLFSGLQWLGIGNTRLSSDGNVGLVKFCSKRPWLALCLEGCEVGCHDGWQFHRSK